MLESEEVSDIIFTEEDLDKVKKLAASIIESSHLLKSQKDTCILCFDDPTLLEKLQREYKTGNSKSLKTIAEQLAKEVAFGKFQARI